MAEYINGSTDILGGSVIRHALNTTTPNQAVIRKIIAGNGISISSTGVDAGTGDVIISIDVSGTGGSGGGSGTPTSVGTVTSVNMVVPAGLTVTGGPVTTAGSLILQLSSGYTIPLIADIQKGISAYNDRIISLSYNTTTGYITLTQLDGGSMIAPITLTPFTTSDLSEGTNLYYTNTRARLALSFVAGSGAYNSATGLITIPTNTNQLTNGAGFITGNQNITLSGDVSGSGTTAITTTLATITQSTGSSFVKISLDTKGRVIGNSNVLSADIITALGYTPYNVTNPAGYQVTSEKGVANGYASLNSSGQVPSTQLPSYVDDVLEYANLAAFPATGESGKIYVTADTNKTYRWTGTVYVEISASPGSTDAVTEGTTNLYFTNARARAAISLTTTGTSGAATYNSTTGVLNVPQYGDLSGSGTATQVAFFTGTKVISSDSGLYWDNTNKRLGISTSTPYSSLQIGSTSGAKYLGIVDTADTNYNIAYVGHNADKLHIGFSNSNTSISERNAISINSSDLYVGIGVSAPVNRLQVGSMGSTGFSGNHLAFGNGAAATAFFQGSSYTIMYLSTYLSILPSGSGTGNMVVGALNSTGYRLEVVGTMRVTSTLTLESVAAATVNTDKYLVSDGNIVKYRTAAQILSDIGGQASGSYVPTSRTLTINGTAFDLTANRTWSVGTVTSVSGDGTVSGLTLTGTVTGSGSLTLGGTLSLTSLNVTNALGYTPYNSTNPNSYISAAQTYYIGTTQNALNRSSAAQTLTGVSIDGSAGTAYLLNVDNPVTYGRSGLQFAQSYNTAGNNPSIHQTPTADSWWHVIRMNHGNNAGYYADLAVSMTSNLGLARRVISAGTQLSNWVTILDALNYNSYALPLAGGTMTGKIITPSTDAGSYGGALEIRERGYALATQSSWDYSPAITFHWGNRVVKRFGLRSDGYMAVDEDPIVIQNGATWGISITGNAATATYLKSAYPYNINITDSTTAATLTEPNSLTSVSMHATHGFFSGFATTLTMSGYDRYGAYQISGGYNATVPDLAMRNFNQGINGFTSWVRILSSSNYNSYAPTLGGTGATGNWGINVTGTAGSTSVLTASGALTTQQGSGTVIYTYALPTTTTGLFASSDNSNSILTVNRHPGDYYSQLGFSSNGSLYYRRFSNTAINTSDAWQTIWTSSNDGAGSGLDADLLDGYNASGTVGVNTVVIRDASGYAFFNYLNSNVNETENPTINSFYTSNGDGYFRKATVAHVRNTVLNDTLATVTGRGNTTSTATYFNNGAYASNFGVGEMSFTSNQLYRASANEMYLNYSGTGQTIIGNAAGITINGALTGTSATFSSSITSSDIYINNANPTLYLRDTDHRSAMIHVNSNTFYVLRGSGTNSTSWTQYGSYWPLEINLENNNATFGGNLTAVGDVTAYSDIRLKENIVTVENALEKVTGLRGVTYNRKDNKSTERHLGVIAQEVEKILPEVVKEDDKGIKHVAYGNMVGVLIEAIKEQQTQIEQLKKQIELLVENR